MAEKLAVVVLMGSWAGADDDFYIANGSSARLPVRPYASAWIV